MVWDEVVALPVDVGLTAVVGEPPVVGDDCDFPHRSPQERRRDNQYNSEPPKTV